MDAGWIGAGKVRARERDEALEIVIDGLTTQAKYYKPLCYEFFRKEWRGRRPAWGEYAVQIDMEYVGEAPWLDLDNLAKALLDAIKGYAFHDDMQVGRLLVERRRGERERIAIRVTRHRPEASARPGLQRAPGGQHRGGGGEHQHGQRVAQLAPGAPSLDAAGAGEDARQLRQLREREQRRPLRQRLGRAVEHGTVHHL